MATFATPGTPSSRGWSVQRAITDFSIGVTSSEASENISRRLAEEYGWSITGGLEMFGNAAAPIWVRRSWTS
jgi:hypothetical protein